MTIYPAPKPAPRKKVPKPLKRSARINPVNVERKAEAFKQDYHSEEFVQWVHSLGCSVAGCRETKIEAAHAVSRGAGGTWADVLPLCQVHHQLSHTLGATNFDRRFDMDSQLIASAVHQRWLAFTKEEK